MRAMLRFTMVLAAIFAAIYLGLCVLLVSAQRKFIYLPYKAIETTPADYGAAFSEVWIPGADNTQLHAWWIPAPRQPAPTLLYFHGNGVNISANAAQGVRLSEICCNVLLFDYRGYGKSSGPFPAEKRVYEDAEAAWRYLLDTRRVPPRGVILYGHSLGGAVAIEMAKRHPDAAALIVESTFTSVADRAGMESMYRVFPLHLLIHQRFDSLRKIADVHIPVLLVHGEDDLVIPSSMSRELYAAANEPKQLVIIAGAGHENTAIVGGERYEAAVRDFVASARPTSLVANR